MQATAHTILVAEDDPEWQDILKETLTDEGYQVCIAKTYDAARELMDSGNIDLLVLDLSLAGTSPVLDGTRLLRRLQHKGIHIPCIIVSGIGTIPLVRQAFTEFLVKDFIEKDSFDFRAFGSAVRSAIESAPPKHSRLTNQSLRVHVSAPIGDVYPITIHAPAGQHGLDMPRRDLDQQCLMSQTPGEREAKHIGSTLFGALFQNGSIGLELLRRSQDRLTTDQSLKIELSTDMTGLAGPDSIFSWLWEYLYDTDRQEFVNLSPQCRLTRHIPIIRSHSFPRLHHQACLLVVSAQPQDLPPLQIEHEIQLIQQAVQDQSVQVRVLERATRETLYDALHSQSIQALHLVGHGAWNPEWLQSVFYLQDAYGRADPVDGERLARLILGECGPMIRIVFLNACQTADGARSDSPAALYGMAGQLALRGVPSVIGMRFAISDDAAVEFARQFYHDWLSSHSVCEAVAAARRRIYLHRQGHAAEWGVPILFES